MKRIKAISKVRMLEAHVQQGLVLSFLEKQLLEVWNSATQKEGKEQPA